MVVYHFTFDFLLFPSAHSRVLHAHPFPNTTSTVRTIGMWWCGCVGSESE